MLVHWWVNDSTLLRVFEFYSRLSLQQKTCEFIDCGQPMVVKVGSLL